MTNIDGPFARGKPYTNQINGSQQYQLGSLSINRHNSFAVRFHYTIISLSIYRHHLHLNQVEFLDVSFISVPGTIVHSLHILANYWQISYFGEERGGRRGNGSGVFPY